MTHGSLFSGIGGFELAAEWMGWENLFSCEWEDFPQKILKYYWPNAEHYGDIKKTDFTIWRGRIDILTGGFPCQPYSQAGKRLGKEDERHLWPEMLRAIREIRPRWIVGENVLGIVNWNGGMVFEEVQADLEAEAYEVQPFILPAAGVGAPHQRYRTWFVAHNTGARTREDIGRLRGVSDGLGEWAKGFTPHAHNPGTLIGLRVNREWAKEMQGGQSQSESWKNCRDAADTTKFRCGKGGGEYNNNREWAICTNKQNKWREVWGEFKNGYELYYKRNWQDFPTQPPICGGDDGIPTQLDGITFPKWRNESIKAYGNAIVPQVALQIFKAIQEYDNHHSL